MPANTTARPVHQYTLKVTLKDVRPPIWRRLLVPGDVLLGDLHVVIQVAMGWEEAHLHEFVVNGARYGEVRDNDWGMDELLNEDGLTLDELGCSEGSKFQYLYDFGDGWQHEVLVEKREVIAEQGWQIACLTGRRACPPEDCGGPFAYMQVLPSLQGQGAPLDDYLTDFFDGFDPAFFDLPSVNQELAALCQEP